MANRNCNRCGLEKPVSDFPANSLCVGGIDRICRECKNFRQRMYRAHTANEQTKKYEKSRNGFLMRIYRNMQSRVTGVQKLKHHLYAGKSLLSRDEFYAWTKPHPEFNRLFSLYEASDFDQRLAPSVDRIDSARGYELDNMEWVTHSENSRRGTISRFRQVEAA